MTLGIYSIQYWAYLVFSIIRGRDRHWAYLVFSIIKGRGGHWAYLEFSIIREGWTLGISSRAV